MGLYQNNFAVSLAAIAAILLLFGTVMAVSDTAATSATLTVNEFLSVTLTSAPVQFGSLDPGVTQNAQPSNGYPLVATIGSESNVNATVATKADNPSFTGPATINVSSMEWTEDISGTPTWTDYSTGSATVCPAVSPGGACNIYHRVSAPPGQTAGDYTVGITITATNI